MDDGWMEHVIYLSQSARFQAVPALYTTQAARAHCYWLGRIKIHGQIGQQRDSDGLAVG